jgi:hypothetical protein
MSCNLGAGVGVLLNEWKGKMKSEEEQEFNDYIHNAIYNILNHKLPTQEESDANFKLQAEWLCSNAFSAAPSSAGTKDFEVEKQKLRTQYTKLLELMKPPIKDLPEDHYSLGNSLNLFVDTILTETHTKDLANGATNVMNNSLRYCYIANECLDIIGTLFDSEEK